VEPVTPPAGVTGLRQGGPVPGTPPAPVDVAVPEPGQRIPDVRGISPPPAPDGRRSAVTGTRVRPGRPADQGHGPGAVRVRATSPHATVEARTASPPGHYRPGLCRQ